MHFGLFKGLGPGRSSLTWGLCGDLHSLDVFALFFSLKISNKQDVADRVFDLLQVGAG